MKKIFLLSILLFQLTFVFGQVKTENKKGNQGMATGDYKPNSQEAPPKNSNINYNDRAYQNECYKSFAFTVKNYGYNKDGGFYSWGVAVKNNYSKAVQLKYKLIVGNDNPQNGTLTYYIKPGETYSNDFGKIKAKIVSNNSDQYRIEVSDVCFEGQDCLKNGYADCNGKQSNNINSNTTSTYSNNNSINQNNKSNTSITQQNDLTEYNRSKADLERQMAEKNAEIQRQNQRITQENARRAEEERQKKIQLQQQYNNSFNQAQQNINNKDYTGAMQSYTNAINSATTKSEKNLAATGVVISSVGSMFDALAKAKEQKRERERIETEQKVRELQQATNIMEANWNDAKTLAEQGDYNQATKLMLPYLNANKINAYSTSLIGFWYGQLKNYESAKICYDKALKLDSKSCAMHYLGDMYRYGQGVEVNYETALFYYKKSCENEDKTGCENYNKLKPLIDDVIKK